ncbi:MAG: phage holin family protein [Clostridia bacterium]|nr:phage holin family protein [Clostridia bacterium]
MFLKLGSLDLWDIVRWLGASLAACATYIFGGADKWLLGLLIVVIIDYFSGVIAAALAHELSSKKGFAGILKKVLIFCIVAVAHIVDTATDAGGVLRALTIGFLLANECISVLENAGRCGVPLPQKLLTVLEQLRADAQHSDEDKTNTDN